MQAPFWSQGLNRYSYVFNDPVNNVDPSGFVTRDEAITGAVLGTAAGVLGYGIATELGLGFSMPSSATMGTIGTGVLSSAFSVGRTVLGGGLGGARSGGSYSVPASSAPVAASKGTAAAQQTSGRPGPDAPHAEANQAGALEDRSRFAGAEYAISRALFGPTAGRSLMRAARIAVNFWNIPANDVFTAERLSAGRDAAKTAFYPDSGAIAITFAKDHMTDARWVLSTAYHEGIHVGQYTTGNYAPFPDTGFHVNELEALSGEIEIAPRLQIKDSQLAQLRGKWNELYDEHIFGTRYQKGVDSGNYKLR